jgi:hypothetical protein
MKASDLCVIRKPCEATDSMGGGGPQCYSYLADLEGKAFTAKLIEATILDIRDAAFYLRKVNARKSGYTIVGLGDAIAQELDLDFGTNLALDG